MKKIAYPLLFLISFCFSFSEGHCAQDEVDVRIEKLQKFRVKGWCLVPWNDYYATAEFLKIEDGMATLKVHPVDLPFSEWPTLVYDIKDLESVTMAKSDNIDALIASLKKKSGLASPAIENAFRAIDRSWFCAENPYFDAAIGIGHGMCISTPHMHSWGLELSRDLLPDAKTILDLGSGTGYLTAMFSQLAPNAEIVGIEHFEDFVVKSRDVISQHLPKEMTDRITILTGDAEQGFADKAPYSIIYVGFMCEKIPQALIDQLAPGGRLIIPVGNGTSSFDSRLVSGRLYAVDKLEDGTIVENPLFSCSFVPSFSPKD